MSPLGLTLFTVALTAVVAIILAFCKTFLIKSKPSKHEESAPKKEPEKREKTSAEPKGTEKPKKSIRNKETPSEEPESAAEIQEVPRESSESIQPTSHTDTLEDRSRGQVKEKKKSFFIFGKTRFEGCPHEFGHLRKLPRNSPIPDECFGCSQILECLKA